MKIEVIDQGFEAHDIYELIYTRTGFRLVVTGFIPDSQESMYMEIFFPDIRGVRVLDEGDLIKFWETEQFKEPHCVYQIQEGGWLSENMSGILSVTASVGDYLEFLVATNDYCASIIASEKPMIKIYSDPNPLVQ